MKVANTLTFEGAISSYENFSNNFIRTRMRVFAFGENRNGSAFNKVTDKAQNSLKMIPIVAKYTPHNDIYGNSGDLEGHNVKLKKDDNGNYDFFMDTFPFGTTGADTSYWFEEVNEGTDLNPNYKTYVVIDNVYLWKRYDATKKITEWISQGIVPKISMEIDDVSGQFDSNGYFQIEDFEFRAIAALGSDVEPCFPRAEIEVYSKQSFKEEFKELVYELNETLKSDQQGGTGMEDVKVTEQEVEAPIEETEQVETQVEAPEEDEVKVDEVVPVEEQEVVVEEAPESNEQPEEEIVEEQPIEEAQEEEQAPEAEPIDYEAKYTELQNDFTSLQSQLDELKSYKRNREEEDMKAQFADKLSEEELSQVFTAMKESTMEDIEVKLFALYGKKNFSTVKPQTQPTNKLAFSLPKDSDSVANPYGDIFEK